MNDQDFQAKLGDLIAQISTLPEDQRERLTQLVDEARDRQSRMKRTVAELQDSLDYLRLSIKYMLFDLEATRRENAYLRKLLEKQSAGNNDETDAGE